MRILTYGATGVQGGPVARKLAQKGHRVRALVRDPQKASDLAGVELVAGDLSDYDGVAAATKGVDRVFFHLPLIFDRETGLTYAHNVVDTAKRAGVDLLVFNTSTIVPPKDTGHLHLDVKREIEAYCRKVGLPTISLRPRLYYEVLAGEWIAQGLKANATLAYPLPADHSASWVTVEDMAAMAVAALDRPDLAGTALEIGGPQPLSGSDLADAFSRAWGRPIQYYPLSVEQFETGLKQAFGDHVGAVIAAPFQYFNGVGPQGLVVGDAASTAKKLGVKLTGLEDWIRARDWSAGQ